MLRPERKSNFFSTISRSNSIKLSHSINQNKESQTTITQEGENLKNSSQYMQCNRSKRNGLLSELELPIESCILSKQAYSQYYPSNNTQLLSKRVSFADNHQLRTIKSEVHLQPRERSTSILKKGSLFKRQLKQTINSRSSSINSHSSSIQNKATLKMTPQSTTNSYTLKKYNELLTSFKLKNKTQKGKQRIQQKFTDYMFPPIQCSIFTSTKQKGSQIKWRRISQIFNKQKLQIFEQQSYSQNLQILAGRYSSQYICSAFKYISKCRSLIKQIFKQCKQNIYGIYCVRICGDNGWKSIIIDDFIPVIQTQKNSCTPAFINIKNTKEGAYRKSSLQIWPLLLEKAYASYYSTYETLQFGNFEDFLQQITGFSITENSPSYKSCEQDIIVPTEFQKQTTSQIFKLIKYRSANQTISKIIPPKDNYQSLSPNIYLRKVILSSNSNLNIMVRQKDERYYHRSALCHNYIWNRVILLFKQYKDSYTWIDGNYSNKKSINMLIQNAKAGQYYILIQPEWKRMHRHPINLIVKSQSAALEIECLPYQYKEQILEKGCADLAQRQGHFRQLNKISCSYQLIHYKSALIIQNVHNQRISGEIVICRLLNTSLKSIIPFNPIFVSAFIKNIKRIDIQIQKDSSHTTVFQSVGGKSKQLQLYSF